MAKTRRLIRLAKTRRVDGLVISGRLDRLAESRRVGRLAKTRRVDGLVLSGRLDRLAKTRRVGRLAKTRRVDGLVLSGRLDRLAMSRRLGRSGLTWTGRLIRARRLTLAGRVSCGMLADAGLPRRARLFATVRCGTQRPAKVLLAGACGLAWPGAWLCATVLSGA